MLSCAELIVKVLDGAGQPLNDEEIEPEVREYAEAIKKRYGELKREHVSGPQHIWRGWKSLGRYSLLISQNYSPG